MFPKSQAFDENYLQRGEIHNIYYYRYGNPEGIPVVFYTGDLAVELVGIIIGILTLKNITLFYLINEAVEKALPFPS